MNVRLRMYQALLFRFGRHLCEGSITHLSKVKAKQQQDTQVLHSHDFSPANKNDVNGLYIRKTRYTKRKQRHVGYNIRKL